MGHYHYHHLILALFALVCRSAVLGHPLSTEDAAQQQQQQQQRQQQQQDSKVNVGSTTMAEKDLR